MKEINLDKILAHVKPGIAPPPPMRFEGKVYRFKAFTVAAAAGIEAVNEPIEGESAIDREQRALNYLADQFDGDAPPFVRVDLKAIEGQPAYVEATTFAGTVLRLLTLWFVEMAQKKQGLAGAEMARQIADVMGTTTADTTSSS